MCGRPVRRRERPSHADAAEAASAPSFDRERLDARAPRAAPSRSALEELGARLDPRFTFETFVVGKPNEFAVAAAERVALSAKPPFNPLFLYGGVGLGKTHLMHAIAWRVKQLDPSATVVYLSAEKFMYQFVRALRTQDTMTSSRSCSARSTC